MNILDNIYKSSLIQNEQNIKFWEDYLRNLNELDLNAYSDKLTVPVLVPIGNRIFFRGAIKHTNEVLVPLGADYFTKCSVKQAEILRQHRIKDAKQKLDAYYREKEYLESQMSFNKENIYGNSGQEIIEVVSEDEDKVWREKHKERLRQYNQNKSKELEVSNKDITDEELWLRLEELELQEEMQNEFGDTDDNNITDIDESDGSSYDSFIIKEDDVSNIQTDEINQNNIIEQAHITRNIPKQTSKIDLLQQVIDRQKMLEVKLTELKNRERNESKSENDLLNRLDEMEQLEELEDEMDRLDDIIEEDDTEDDYANNKTSPIETSEKKRSVSFADSDDAETLEITFRHSNIDPCTESYRPEKGITKPSDIYEAYSNLFTNKKSSILKKSKYKETILHDQINNNVLEENNTKQGSPNVMPLTQSDVNVNKTILINDIVEKTNDEESKVKSGKRPVSLFKQRRQQQKS